MPAVTSSDSLLALTDGPRGREIGVEIELIAMGAVGGRVDDDDDDDDDESAVEDVDVDVDVERVDEEVNGVVYASVTPSLPIGVLVLLPELVGVLVESLLWGETGTGETLTGGGVFVFIPGGGGVESDGGGVESGGGGRDSEAPSESFFF